jgi:hypothetical protein
MRHTFASWALRDGVSLFYMSRIMGTSIALLDSTYGHLVPDSEEIRGLLEAGERTRLGHSGHGSRPLETRKPPYPQGVFPSCG